ncbi:MAG: carbon-nitrogen hydrolase family protein, partial [Microterricola sp.]
MPTIVRVTVAQVSTVIGNVQANLDSYEAVIRSLAADGVALVVFPECGLTGYLFDSAEEVKAAAILADGPEIQRLRAISRELGIVTVVGFLQTDPTTNKRYNTAATIDGDEVTLYQKAHLPYLGADRFVDVGDHAPVVVDTRAGRIGMNICYDLRYPEWARSLGLDGAQIMVHLTNWALQAEPVARILPPARAMENAMYVLVADRGDSERGVDFVGLSGIYEPNGSTRLLCERGDHLLTADIDLDLARRSKIVIDPGVFELD